MNRTTRRRVAATAATCAGGSIAGWRSTRSARRRRSDPSHGVDDVLRRHAVRLAKVRLTAHDRRKSAAESDAPEGPRRGAGLEQNLGDRPTQSTFDHVLLDGDDPPGVAGSVDE